jgi:hypothetical protein
MTCRAIVLHAAAAAILVMPRSAAAQSSYGRESQYEQMYGQPVDVSITDLAQNPDAYIERAVRTRGRLELLPGIRNAYSMRDSFGATVQIVPVEEVRGHFESEAMGIMGRDIDIVGVVKDTGDAGRDARPGLVTRRHPLLVLRGPPEKPSPDILKKAAQVSLENPVTSPGQRDGQLVRVVGMFRGSNLYGDLPSQSQRQRGDWSSRRGLRGVGDGEEARARASTSTPR